MLDTGRVVAVLVTGMSGAGKSTALAGLARRGFETVDTDDPGWIEVVDGEPLWREERMRALLARPRNRPLFVSGAVRNQGRFPFDAVVLLSAPIEVLLARIAVRTTNDYGKAAEERDAVVRDHREVEPLLRAAAALEIDTRTPEEEVVAALEALAERLSA